MPRKKPGVWVLVRWAEVVKVSQSQKVECKTPGNLAIPEGSGSRALLSISREVIQRELWTHGVVDQRASIPNTGMQPLGSHILYCSGTQKKKISE